MEQLRQGTSIQRIVSATAPTERADGTALSTNEISHYNWYMSLDGGAVQLVGAVALTIRCILVPCRNCSIIQYPQIQRL